MSICNGRGKEITTLSIQHAIMKITKRHFNKTFLTSCYEQNVGINTFSLSLSLSRNLNKNRTWLCTGGGEGGWGESQLAAS